MPLAPHSAFLPLPLCIVQEAQEAAPLHHEALVWPLEMAPCTWRTLHAALDLLTPDIRFASVSWILLTTLDS